MVLLSLSIGRGGTTAQTDLASITVTPLANQATAKADWQTIYEYSGGVLPPGTRLTSEGKWVDPSVRQDKSGVTFGFPNLPDSPENSQNLKIGFSYDRPLAFYPTRATIQYTSFFDQTMPKEWSPFTFTSGSGDRVLLGHVSTGGGGEAEAPSPGGAKHAAAGKKKTVEAIPVKVVGDNTFSISMGGETDATVTMNGQDATDFFLKKSEKVDKLKSGAMLLNGVAICNDATQFPHNKGDWFAVHSFKIEQMRPPLEDSSEAAIDLTVPGSDPITVTIEVVDGWNDSKGFVLRDMQVAPGKYRLYWDGIDQKSIAPKDTMWVGAGSYTFRLTTGKTAVHFAGEINNSAPKYTTRSYGMDNCTALAITPPGTSLVADRSPKWAAKNNADDTRKLDTTDSLQTVGVSYDAVHGQWICADGTVISTRMGDDRLQGSRGLAITPPDPTDPTNLDKQYYFVSMNSHGGNAIISSGMTAAGKAPPKTLTDPDWNRTKSGFVSYQIQLGQIPGGATLGPQHVLFFKTSPPLNGGPTQAEWIFRNVRLYEEGSPDPGPTTFDPSKFSARIGTGGRTLDSAPAPITAISETTPPVPSKTVTRTKPIPPGSVTIEDNGHAVHLKNPISVNYPYEYTITDKTIMAFDLDVIDHSKVGDLDGIGFSPDASGSNREDAGHYFHFLGGRAAHDPRDGFNDPTLGAFSYPTYAPSTLYTDSVPLPPVNAPSAGGKGFLWQPGFYGLKITEDGKYLLACNNADNRLEVRDISTDGHAVAKIPIDYPMFVTLAPKGAAGAPAGTRYVYVDSPNEGLLRIAWHLADNTFGKPETLTQASEFAYPRGLVYDAVAGRIFVCDTFNMDRSKSANQIAVIDPNTGKILSRFGKEGGVDPKTGGAIDEETFTCPLTVDVDSKGALWVNDYFSCEVRKYNFDPASNGFKLERRVMGANMTNVSHFYWLPDAPPTQVWTLAAYFVRNEADFDSDGRFANQRTTSATYQLTPDALRPYAHFTKVGDHIYATFSKEDTVYEKVGDGWKSRFSFGGNTQGREVESAEATAYKAGLLAMPGQPPTDLDKAIAASGDPDWKTRPWVWSDPQRRR